MANNDKKADHDTSSQSTGAGAEAAEGLHSAQGNRKKEQKSGLTDRSSASDNRSGSEPLDQRTSEHKGSYGGEGGAPRKPSA